MGNFAEVVTLRCSLKGVSLNCMVDSGAGCSLITKGVLQRIPNVKLSPADKTLKDASQNIISLIGKVTIPVTINGDNKETLRKEVTFYVSDADSANCVLLGRTFMQSFGSVSFNFDTNRIKLGKTWCTGLKMDGGRVKVAEEAIVPARTEKLVKMRWRKGNGLVMADFVPDTHNGNPGLYVTKTRIVPDADGIFLIGVVNTTEKEIRLRKDGRLGKLTACAETVAEVDFEGGGKGVEWDKAVIGDVTEADRTKILTLLKEYEDVFARNPKKPKLVNNATHTIETAENRPVFRKPY